MKIDGKEDGGTPVVVELSPGRHVVRIERTGFTAIERDIAMKASQTVTVKGELLL